MKRTYLVAALSLAFAATGAHAERLVIKGSDTLGAKLVPQLAEQFKSQNPGTTFDIAAEGSTTGIAAIIDGTAQIGMSSRRAKPAEVGAAQGKGVNMKPTIVAYDGMAVIVNAKNPIKALTKKQVEQIFTGDVTDWSAVGGTGGKISIYTRNTSSGHLLRLERARDEEARLRRRLAEDGRQRTDRRRGRQEPERHRLRRPGLYESRRRQSHADRWRHALQSSRCRARATLMRVRPSTTPTATRRASRSNSSTSRSARRARRVVAQVGFVPVK